MKVLGIVCSPRSHGNTEIMVQAVLDSAKEAGAEIELVSMAGKTIRPCDACHSCVESGECKIKDDMQEIYPKLLEADGIVFGTPVYFWTLSAQAKTVIDRTYAFLDRGKPVSSLVTHSGGSLKGKVGAVVVTTRRVATTSAMSVFFDFFNLHRMIIAGGTEGLSDPFRTLHVEGKDDKGAVRNDKVGMAQAVALGRSVVKRIRARV